jgi:uracil-DNA glycosylase
MANKFDVRVLINNLNNDWVDVLLDIVSRYEDDINEQLDKEMKTFQDILEVLPPQDSILNAFKYCPLDDVKVVIVGQDCYPTKGHAMGICFSVPITEKCPPSLRNIFKELEHEYHVKRNDTDLTDWAKQGVLMLNTALTVRQGCAGSHIKIWKGFTTDVIKFLASNGKNLCYILWGEHAISFKQYIDETRNCVLTHSHPSPLSRRPFIGCNHFQLCNNYLASIEKIPIKWV